MKKAIIIVLLGLGLGFLPAFFEALLFFLNIRTVFATSLWHFNEIYYWPGVYLLELFGFAWQGAADGHTRKLVGGPLAVLECFIEFQLMAGIIYSVIISSFIYTSNLVLKITQTKRGPFRFMTIYQKSEFKERMYYWSLYLFVGFSALRMVSTAVSVIFLEDGGKSLNKGMLYVHAGGCVLSFIIGMLALPLKKSQLFWIIPALLHSIIIISILN